MRAAGTIQDLEVLRIAVGKAKAQPRAIFDDGDIDLCRPEQSGGSAESVAQNCKVRLQRARSEH